MWHLPQTAVRYVMPRSRLQLVRRRLGCVCSHTKSAPGLLSNTSVASAACKSSPWPLCNTTVRCVHAEPKPLPLNLPTQNGSGFSLPNQNGLHLPTQNGCVFTFAEPKRQRLQHAEPKRQSLSIPACRPTAATSEGPTLFFTIPPFSPSHVPNQNGNDFNTPNQNGSRFRFRPADPKRRLVDIVRRLS